MPRPRNALIIEDEPHVRTYLRLLLKQLGLTSVWEATDGESGLSLVREHHPHLVLLDINLPKLSGLEVLQQLANEEPSPPVIIVSAQNLMKTVLECRKLGAVDYVLKHAPTSEALLMLKNAIDRLDHGGSDDTSSPVGPD